MLVTLVTFSRNSPFLESCGDFFGGLPRALFASLQLLSNYKNIPHPIGGAPPIAKIVGVVNF